jgi:GNAT superfamily N-acetyltransferase
MHHDDYRYSARGYSVLPNLSTGLQIRQLVQAEEADMAALLQRLDVQARLDRFGHDPGDINLRAYSRASLATSPAVFGAFIDGRLTGVAEITRCAPESTAILAFAVDAEWRRKGIGCRLLLFALSWADLWGAARVQLQCTRTNWAVRQIAHKVKARINLTAGKFIAEFNTRPLTSAERSNALGQESVVQKARGHRDRAGVERKRVGAGPAFAGTAAGRLCAYRNNA